MKYSLATAAACAALTLGACSTTNVQSTTNEFKAPEAGATTLMVQPDVQLFALLASGIAEPRAEWSEQGEAFLATALEAELKSRSSSVQIMDEDKTLSPQQIQVLKLNDAVMKTSAGYAFLPNKKDVYDLTLGPSAKLLSDGDGTDYALLTSARGSFQTAGKMAVNAALLVLGAATGTGVSLQTGAQNVTVTLIDLETGDLVWTNTAGIGAGSDIRNETGAANIAKTVLKGFPL